MMTMETTMDPINFEEYQQLSAANVRTEGFGLKVCTVLCCPFCAAANWKRMPVMRDDDTLQKPVACPSCKRIARLDIRHPDSGSITMAIVFMSGPEPPAWLPKIWTREDEAPVSVAGVRVHAPIGVTDDPADPALHTKGRDGMNAKYLVLSDEERAKGFVRPVRRTYVHMQCGVATTMGQAIAETYARDPKFYGATYCVHCCKHLPVSEFSWDDGSTVGS
jgi:hypothetical protein